MTSFMAKFNLKATKHVYKMSAFQVVYGHWNAKVGNVKEDKLELYGLGN